MHDHLSCSVASLDPDCSRLVTRAQRPAKAYAFACPEYRDRTNASPRHLARAGPTTLKLLINLAAAKAINLDVPPTLVARAGHLADIA